MSRKGSILGVDVGGTFTDFIHVGEDGRIDIVKTPTTPSEPAQGVLDGLKKLAGSEMSLPEFLGGIDLIVHGTTITTNAVITRNYAKTGYITTKGFKDIVFHQRFFLMSECMKEDRRRYLMPVLGLFLEHILMIFWED